jgi:hypothetical protein
MNFNLKYDSLHTSYELFITQNIVDHTVISTLSIRRTTCICIDFLFRISHEQLAQKYMHLYLFIHSVSYEAY